MGFTEYSLNRALFTLDVKKRNVLYALPNERPDALGFSRGRINGAMELSEYIENMFSVSRSESHKITKDNVNLYIRGARSRICFKQIDVACVILDELDEMTESAISLARYRLSGQLEKQLIMLSTPSVEGVGIQKQYEDSSQAHYFFPCPSCSKHIELTEPCLVVTAESLTDPNINNSHIVCPECGKTLEDRGAAIQNGVWIHTYPERPIRGYHINQLYSSTVSPTDLARQKLRGQTNVVDMIEYYNSSLGQTYTPEGSQLYDKDINAAMMTKNFTSGDSGQRRGRLITMGIDIGQKNHHLTVVGWTFDPAAQGKDIIAASSGNLILFKTIEDLREAHDLIQEWQPNSVVLDAQPLFREVMELVKRYPGLAAACYYSITKGKEIRENDGIIHVNRTYFLDSIVNKIKNKTLHLPRDLSLDFRNHLMASIKTFRRNDKGEVITEFITKSNAPDHYFHSLNYATIALARRAGSGGNQYL